MMMSVSAMEDVPGSGEAAFNDTELIEMEVAVGT